MDAERSFCAPRQLDEALELAADPGALLVGGATSVALLLKHRLVEPSKLVWLGRIPALRGIVVGAGVVRLGATTTLAELAASSELHALVPALSQSAGQVGNARVRAVATLGGALVHADARQDVPPVLLSLGASVEVCGPGGQRQIPLAELFLGFMETSLRPGEIVTAVCLPIVSGRRCAYSRFTPGSADDYPTVGVACSLVVDADGAIAEANLALGGVGPRALGVPAANDLLRGSRLEGELLESLCAAAASTASPIDDQRGSADYKRAMVSLWTRRTLTRCFGTGGPAR